MQKFLVCTIDTARNYMFNVYIRGFHRQHYVQKYSKQVYNMKLSIIILSINFHLLRFLYSQT